MKVKVLRTFVFEKHLYTADTEAEFKAEQVEYLDSTSLELIKKIDETDEEVSAGSEVKEEPKIEKLTAEDYEKLTKKKLVEIAKEKGIQLDETMLKKDMIKELI